MPEDAFLLPDEAARLFASGQRKVLVLSYGWLSAKEADPYGERLRLLRNYIGSLPDANECGLFIDQVCLPQPPRTKEEDEVFFKGLNQMGSLYASVTGSTVIQSKAVPPRPAEFDGQIVIRRLPAIVQEADLKAPARLPRAAAPAAGPADAPGSPASPKTMRTAYAPARAGADV